ncbi:MAG: hypothetical protein IJ374_03455 [Lachnospiraceae bacterium]|nr:hypothetical protein [Lachnospiraceae bacterium]
MALKDHTNDYSDIINLPHHVSKTHPRMSLHDRAAQFSPFAALTGYDAAIKETARWTDEKIDLDETSKVSLDEKLLMIMAKLSEKPMVAFTYFQKDERKAGGSYETTEGRIRKIDFYERVIIMEDHSKIRIEDIIDIDSELFENKMIE